MSGGTAFYRRSAYASVGIEPPNCFLDLDGHFASAGLDVISGLYHDEMVLAENLCRRMGDVDLFAHQIDGLLGSQDDVISVAGIVGSLLVAHFSACKSVLDAAAISLNRTNQLNLSGGDCDFNKQKFWNRLEAANPDACGLLKGLTPTINQVILWRDSAIHRVTPLALATSRQIPNSIPPTYFYTVKLFLERDVGIHRINELTNSGRIKDKWGHPLHFHRLWREDLVRICEIVCDSLAPTGTVYDQRSDDSP